MSLASVISFKKLFQLPTRSLQLVAKNLLQQSQWFQLTVHPKLKMMMNLILHNQSAKPMKPPMIRLQSVQKIKLILENKVHFITF